MNKLIQNGAKQTSPPELNSRLCRQDWLDLATETLVENGIDQIKVQILARKLHVARSSFYWHFKNLQDLLDAILDEWMTKNTAPVIEQALRPAPDINRAVAQVIECWVDEDLFDPRFDIAVRWWARHSDSVRRVVIQADKMRIDALTRMFSKYGIEGHEALIRARVLYYTQIGYFTLDDQEDPVLRFSHAPTYLHIFSGVPLEPSLAEEHVAVVTERYFRGKKKPKKA